MKILIHDFAGHPFQIQLSRELANVGHQVVHVYPNGLPGPKGRIGSAAADAGTFQIRHFPLSIGEKKYSPVHRLLAHRRYAGSLCDFIDEWRPEVVLSGNTPIDIQAQLLAYCNRRQIGFVHWVQDVYCEALRFFLKSKCRPAGDLLTWPWKALEQKIARRSSASVVISDDFASLLKSWQVPAKKISVIENWAPLDEIVPGPSDTRWRAEHALNDKLVFLYSGTLGLKHRPDLLYSLAQSLSDKAYVVVVSEGVGRNWLAAQPNLSNLLLIDFQPYERLSEVLASADVLVATLAADAGRFAVPSKVLTYMCANRPLLIAAPSANLASRLVKYVGSGFAVETHDAAGWVQSAATLADSQDMRNCMASAGRHYAEMAFDISAITARFHSIFAEVAQGTRPGKILRS